MNYPDDERIIYVAGLSTRTAFALSRAGITTMGELRARHAESDRGDLRDIWGIGNKGLRDICALLGVEYLK